MAFLTASFLVAVLSQQFLTVVTPIWRRPSISVWPWQLRKRGAAEMVARTGGEREQEVWVHIQIPQE